jgi:hypothetical protein
MMTSIAYDEAMSTSNNLYAVLRGKFRIKIKKYDDLVILLIRQLFKKSEMRARVLCVEKQRRLVS